MRMVWDEYLLRKSADTATRYKCLRTKIQVTRPPLHSFVGTIRFNCDVSLLSEPLIDKILVVCYQQGGTRVRIRSAGCHFECHIHLGSLNRSNCSKPGQSRAISCLASWSRDAGQPCSRPSCTSLDHDGAKQASCLLAARALRFRAHKTGMLFGSATRRHRTRVSGESLNGLDLLTNRITS
jgi:hypothetical protein